MKKQFNPKKLTVLMAAGIFLLAQTSCKKEVEKLGSGGTTGKTEANASNASLIAYKATSHELAVGYYRTWRDRTVSGNANDPIMTDVPDSLDIVCNFSNYTPPGSSYWTTLKNTYIPALHAKGTKVVNTQGFPSVTDTAYSNHYTNDAAGYAAWALATYNSYNAMGYDGIDFDVEYNPTGATLTTQAGMIKALSQYFGPKSTTGKLLIFDTNQSGTNNLFRQANTYISYLFLQAYGRGTSGMQSTWNTFSPYIQSKQFVIGFSFYEENGYPSNYWDDVIYPRNGTGRAYDYARWEPTTGKKGGVLSYAIDRDAPLTSQHDNTIVKPDFKVTKDLIKIMNP